MTLRSEKRTRFSEELSVVPRWAWIVAGLCLVAAEVGFQTVIAHDPKAPPLWARTLLGILAGFVIACYVLLIGYVNRDALRRGMNRVLWTVLVILVPNALGFVLYFLLRHPLPELCPYCAAQVYAGSCYCAKCGHNLSLLCPKCQHAIHPGDLFCANCGNAVSASDPPQAPAQASMPG
jgi:hypothetical protein